MACSAPWSRAVPVTERSGVDLSAPRRAEAAGDLTEDDGGADFSLAGVVGGRHVGVFEEDEELGSPCLDGGLQLAAGGMRRGHDNKRIETALGSNVILPQRRWR
jgi:hypothetical protein